MKTVSAAAFGGAAYMLAAVSTYQSVTYANLCRPPDNQAIWWDKISVSAAWPAAAILSGFMGVVFGSPGIFACNSRYSKPHNETKR